jgi:hypothetical protein
MREQEIQRAIMDFLEANAITFWRCNMGGVRISGKGRARNPMRGYPDLAGVCPSTQGRLFTIEVKTPTGRLSDDQRKWERKLRASGVVYIIATSVADVRMSLGLDQAQKV